MNIINQKIILNNNYKDLIKKKTYEPILLEIINSSGEIFGEKYKHIDNDKQSNGESDYISVTSGKRLDAKTIFPSSQCEHLSLNQINIFMETTMLESTDTFDSFMNDSGKNLDSTILYKEIENALGKIDDEENVVIFIPYPFTMEEEGALSSILCSDIFTQIIIRIKQKNSEYFKKHEVYFIYPNIENKIIIKDMNNWKTKYLKSDILSKYIYVEH